MNEKQSPIRPYTTPRKRPRWKKWVLIFSLSVVVGLAGMYAGTSVWPSLGSQGAQMLRKVFGNRAVAQLEMLVFDVQDTIQSWMYTSRLVEPSAPWDTPVEQAMLAEVTITPDLAEMSPALTIPPKTQVSVVTESTPTPTSRISTTRTITPQPNEFTHPTHTNTPKTPTAMPLVWPPGELTPLGSLEGEGVWSAYIEASGNRTIAYRTFLQPDPERPYSVVGVIAFDLTHTRLNYVLGSVEPISLDGPKRSGRIPDEDRIPGKLLAAFNGGFQAQHGHFGALSDGIVAIPPQDGLGTVAIYEGGEVDIGAWGEEVTDSPDLRALRQNGPLVIHDGDLTSHVFSFSPKDWGYTINDVSPTWRSGIAIDLARRVLFYVAGPSLTVEALGNSMIAAGGINGIQLDINPYWVHFTTFRIEDGELIPEPLFPDSMNEFVDRYLQPYSHDYFYVTVDYE
jgi:hypothetical protein